MSDRVCKVCGGKVPSRNKHFCSITCYGVWKRSNRRGENNANWKGGKIKFTCVVCGKEFEVFPSSAKRSKKQFCSWECKLIGMRGERAPSWKGGLVTRECETCGAEFSILPSVIEKGHGRFCSRKCAGVAQRNNNIWICEVCGTAFEAPVSQGKRKYCSMKCRTKVWSGAANPNWRGGKSFEPYPPEFNDELKYKIRERDHHTCAICWLPGKPVHHIDYDKNNNDPLNLITLCESCHSVTNYNRPYWQAELSKLQAIRQAPLPLELMRNYTGLNL